MGLGRPAYPFSGSPRSHFWRVDSSHLLEFLSFTIAPLWMLLSWRYLRGKDRIGNPSLNLHLLCLILKYLDLIFVGSVLGSLLEDGCAWMGFESTWALVLPFGLWPPSFSVLVLDHGPRHFMLQNRPKTCKKRSSSKIYVQVWKWPIIRPGSGRLVILILNSCHYQK